MAPPVSSGTAPATLVWVTIAATLVSVLHPSEAAPSETVTATATPASRVGSTDVTGSTAGSGAREVGAPAPPVRAGSVPVDPAPPVPDEGCPPLLLSEQPPN